MLKSSRPVTLILDVIGAFTVPTGAISPVGLASHRLQLHSTLCGRGVVCLVYQETPKPGLVIRAPGAISSSLFVSRELSEKKSIFLMHEIPKFAIRHSPPPSRKRTTAWFSSPVSLIGPPPPSPPLSSPVHDDQAAQNTLTFRHRTAGFTQTRAWQHRIGTAFMSRGLKGWEAGSMVMVFGRDHHGAGAVLLQCLCL